MLSRSGGRHRSPSSFWLHDPSGQCNLAKQSVERPTWVDGIRMYKVKTCQDWKPKEYSYSILDYYYITSTIVIISLTSIPNLDGDKWFPVEKQHGRSSKVPVWIYLGLIMHEDMFTQRPRIYFCPQSAQSRFVFGPRLVVSFFSEGQYAASQELLSL